MADDLYSTDIPWGLPPPSRELVKPTNDPSTADALGMLYADYVALEAHVAALTTDLATTQDLLHMALDRVVTLTAIVTRQKATMMSQTQQIAMLMGVSDTT